MNIDFSNTAIAFRAKSDAELRRSYWLFKAIEHPTLVKVGSTLASAALKLHLPIEFLLKKTFFEQFCGGESIEDSKPTIAGLARYGIGTILDYSVEGLATDEGFDETTEELLRAIRLASTDSSLPFCVFKTTGVARFELLEKIAAAQTLSAVEQSEWQRAYQRIDRICSEAHRSKVRIFIDAEDSWIQDAIDRCAGEMMLRYNRERAIVYNTVQMYRHDRTAFLQASVARAETENFFLGIKLVRGAYMEKERARAARIGAPSPIFPTKQATDEAYDHALRYCIEKIGRVSICAGTHNEKSTRLLTELLESSKIERTDTRVYFAQLLGMSDHITYNLADAGFRVGKYVPYGPIRAAFPYLVRRAEENTSIQGQSGRELTLIEAELKRRKHEKI